MNRNSRNTSEALVRQPGSIEGCNTRRFRLCKRLRPRQSGRQFRVTPSEPERYHVELQLSLQRLLSKLYRIQSSSNRTSRDSSRLTRELQIESPGGTESRDPDDPGSLCRVNTFHHDLRWMLDLMCTQNLCGATSLLELDVTHHSREVARSIDSNSELALIDAQPG